MTFIQSMVVSQYKLLSFLRYSLYPASAVPTSYIRFIPSKMMYRVRLTFDQASLQAKVMYPQVIRQLTRVSSLRKCFEIKTSLCLYVS